MPGNGEDEFDAVVTRLIEAIKTSAASIKASPFYADDRNKAGGVEHLLRTIYQSIDGEFWQDADYPLFRKLDFRACYGGDNPDQQYLKATIKGDANYRIWGRIGTELRIDVSLYEGLPWAGGRTAANISSNALIVGEDGSVEIIASPERVPGNWLHNPPGGTEIMIRQICSDWEREFPSEFHIDLIGQEGALRPNATFDNALRRAKAATEYLPFGVETFLGFVDKQFLQFPVNTLGPVQSRPDVSGAGSRSYAFGHYNLADDEALVVTMHPAGGLYQAIQINNLWFFSPEYQNRQPSLNDRQSVAAGDGAYHYVISAADPLVHNWIDTTGLLQGLILLRYDGLTRGLPEALWPTTKKIKLGDLVKELPEDTVFITPERRAEFIKSRRKGLQLRNLQ